MVHPYIHKIHIFETDFQFTPDSINACNNVLTEYANNMLIKRKVSQKYFLMVLPQTEDHYATLMHLWMYLV